MVLESRSKKRSHGDEQETTKGNAVSDTTLGKHRSLRSLEGLNFFLADVLSMHENGIGTHTNVSQDGFQRILVRPEDEIQAREIVREIESGTPPM